MEEWEVWNFEGEVREEVVDVIGNGKNVVEEKKWVGLKDVEWVSFDEVVVFLIMVFDGFEVDRLVKEGKF